MLASLTTLGEEGSRSTGAGRRRWCPCNVDRPGDVCRCASINGRRGALGRGARGAVDLHNPTHSAAPFGFVGIGTLDMQIPTNSARPV